MAILVNGAKVAIGSKFTVTADTKVNAIVEELPLLQFADTEQSRVYTTQTGVQNFILRTIPAGVAGLQISYKQGDTKVENPTEVGTYDVFVAYTAEATNKVYSLPTEKIGTFTITKAQYPAPIPTKNDVGNGSDDKKYKWKGNASGNFRTAIYILTTEEQKNYEDPEFNILYGDNVPKANLTTGPQTKATLRAAGDVTITLQANGGSIVAYNGPTEIGDVATYVGQTITLKALPDRDHTVKGISWKVGDESKTANADGSLTLALPETEMTITATFAEKEEAAKPSVTIHNGTYNGVVYGGASVTDVPAGWNVFFKQNETMISEPIAAGDYEVYVSRSEDADYKATTHYVGTMEIAKATPVLSDLKGSEILKGSPLSQSVISGTSNAEGTFAWVNPDQVMHTEGDMEAEVKFTSTNPNYADATGTAKVTVKAQAAGVTTRKLTLTVNGAEHGTVKILLDGTEVISGTAISKGQVLKVTATANRGYILESVKINGTAVSETYTVGEEGDVEIVVTFKKDSTQGGSDEPIDPSEPETIPDPVVAERTATTAVITWEKIDGATGYKLHLYAKKGDATPLKTYEFDAEGNLKATGISFTLTGLTAGESYYVETVAITPQGEVKRGIELTGTPTGIEAIAEGSQLYTIKGAIVIVPTSPIEVMIVSANGRPIFHDEVSGYTQVTANAGIYVVVLKKGNEQVVEKVVVK